MLVKPGAGGCSDVILRLLSVTGGPPAAHPAGSLPVSLIPHTTGPDTVVILLGSLAVVIAVARLLRHLVSVAFGLFRSAGAAAAVLILLLGTGSALGTALVLYVVNR